jgi:hypothetical protein
MAIVQRRAAKVVKKTVLNVALTQPKVELLLDEEYERKNAKIASKSKKEASRLARPTQLVTVST